jgi:hypothetical protein
MRIHVHNTFRIFEGVTILLFLSVLISVSVSALARGYATSDTGLREGMIVSVIAEESSDTRSVERATIDNGNKVIGVAVNVDENLLTTGASGQQVYIQTDGEAQAFVSDINGAPKKGDLLAVSPLKGILVKSDTNTSTVVGTALEDFDETVAITQEVDRNNSPEEVKIDKLRVNLDLKGIEQGKTDVDSSLERLGRSIVGREVGEIRVVVALVIFLVVLVAEGGIIYGAISSAITSLGRNPMARKIIVREMIRVVVIAVSVLGFGLASIYAILWI